MWGCKNWQSEEVYLYQQRMSSGMEQKSWARRLAAVTERSYKLRLWLKRWGLKSFQGIGSYKQVVSTAIWMDRPERFSGAKSLKDRRYPLSIRSKLPAPCIMTLCSPCRKHMGTGILFSIWKKIFFLFCLFERKKISPPILEEIPRGIGFQLTLREQY